MPSLPPLFLDRIRSFLNAEDYDSVLRAFSETRQASFRINTLKAKKADVLDELRTRGISCDPHPTIPDTFLVPKEHEYALK
jgi:16S rRNA C967 or C1407 C5-methylase (RsmB/RsmF family)